MYLLDTGVVNEAGICTGASDDEPGPEQLGRQLHLVVIYESCCRLERGRHIKESQTSQNKDSEEEVEGEGQDTREKVEVKE